MTAAFRVESWADLPRIISQLQAAGVGHRIPLLQALLHGRIAYLELERGSSAALFKPWASMIRLPGVVLIGDDDHAAVDGPDTWAIARRAIQWARFILIHGGPGAPEHYRYALRLAAAYDRLLLVECASTTIEAWQAAASRWADRAEGLVFVPPPGAAHPAVAKGVVH